MSSRFHFLQKSISRVQTPSPRLSIESLEDRTTPDVKVFNLANTLIATHTGATALATAVNDPSTLDGFTLKLDATNGSVYSSPGLIPKSLSILGPNDGISPITGSRLPEVNIDTSNSFLNVASDKTVAIRGLSFATPNGKGALTVFASNYHVDFSFNVVANQNPVYRAVYVDSNGGPGYASAKITHNAITNTSPTRAAIMLGTGSNGVVSENRINGALVGVQLQSDLPSGCNNPLVTNNYIADTVEEGIKIGDAVANAKVTFNTILNANTSNRAERGGIRIYGDYNGPGVDGDGPTGGLDVTNNLVVNANTGIVFSAGSYPTGLTNLNISLNSINVRCGTRPVDLTEAYGKSVDVSGNWFGRSTALGVQNQLAGDADLKVYSFLSGGANARQGLSANLANYGFVPNISVALCGGSRVVMIVPSPTGSSTPQVLGRVQTGVSRATDGMTVRVEPGVYCENVTLTGRSVVIQARWVNSVKIQGTVSGTAVAGTDKFVSLVKVDVTGGGSIQGYDEFSLISTACTSGVYKVSGSAVNRAGDQATGTFALANVGEINIVAGQKKDTFHVTPPTVASGVRINIDGGSGRDRAYFTVADLYDTVSLDQI